MDKVIREILEEKVKHLEGEINQAISAAKSHQKTADFFKEKEIKNKKYQAYIKSLLEKGKKSEFLLKP